MYSVADLIDPAQLEQLEGFGTIGGKAGICDWESPELASSCPLQIRLHL